MENFSSENFMLSHSWPNVEILISQQLVWKYKKKKKNCQKLNLT